MPIHSDKNLYPGVNPHLNSELQQPHSEWASFHSDFITLLRVELDTILPRPYYVASELSLQVGTYDRLSDAPFGRPTRTIPDVAIVRPTSFTEHGGSKQRGNPTFTMPLIETVEDEEELYAVVIYRSDTASKRGVPVTRLEVLSPANKYGGSHYASYLTKRQETLYSSICLVELDFLHEQQALLKYIPNYLAREENAFPYAIIVNDPHPTFDEGIVNVFGFGVLDPLPVLDIPLAGSDFVTVDFGPIYNRTMESSRLFREILVDYEKDPVNFEAYHEADRAAIREHMAKIAAEHALKRE
jgi:hypothetical protein